MSTATPFFLPSRFLQFKVPGIDNAFKPWTLAGRGLPSFMS